jgi:cytochrome d ubiquinol oxidase subunit I
MWLVHLGTLASSWFILAANSWMQHPVGYRYNAEAGRAELTDFWAVMFNKVQVVTFPHVIFAAYMTAGTFLLGVSAYLYMKKKHEADRPMYHRAIRIGAVITLLAGIGVAVTGDLQGKVMTEVQPMKMAAAEGLYDTTSSAPFSVLSIGSLDGSEATRIIEIPGLLSFMATGSFDGTVEGINDLKVSEQEMAQQVAERYGPQVAALVTADSYTPLIPLTYWSFRFMIGLGALTMLFAALTLWGTRKGAVPVSTWWVWVAVLTPLAPVFANSWGWIFTEVGRQPWIVYGLMTTSTGVSPSVSTGEVWFSMIAYTLVYAVLAVIEIKLFLTYVRRGADPFEDPADHADKDEDAPLQFAY